MDVYRDCELHRRRPGRIYEDRDVDDFRRGLVKLQNGKLKKWVADTTGARNLSKSTGSTTAVPEDHDLQPDEDEDNFADQDDTGHSGEEMSFGFMQMVDGELVVETLDATELDELIAAFEQEYTSGEDEL
ncbi:hypothetical protein Hypma_007321 [Hypsizygus marmoreus]|uniref:Uncharacterized protein n=1 Tax=Hypsizygus marmoreus TaxID=39966 RepID=A0A369KAL2_HYPMA|nr:hypothetical protein Hypma_007321 [Hypsizygus marmoreus]